MTRVKNVIIAALALIAVLPTRAAALERLCDPAFEDCRAPLLQLIDNETVSIDFAFWFLEDDYYAQALVRAAQRGVKIRVMFDSESLPGYDTRQFIFNRLVEADIPIREKVSPGILHWKMMLFGAQNTVEFSGGNFTAEAFVPQEPYSAYVDEVIYFTEKPAIVNSFKTKFDDVWTDTVDYADYANVTVRNRSYPTFPIDAQMNFPPSQVLQHQFRERSVQQYNAETQGVDAIIYRITDRAHTDALIDAINRGVRLRLITEPAQYRDESRLWHAWNVDRLYMAGQQHFIGGTPGSEIRHRHHLGLTHEKLTLLNGQGMVIFGSSNWTSPSTEYQLEHNLFTTDSVFFNWARDHFDRKWYNLGPAQETEPFVPLPPDVPALVAPASGATNQPTSVSFQWRAGPWAHKYDLYLGTDPNNLALVLSDSELGPYDITWAFAGLSGGTTYHWRVVSRTMANQSRTSDTWSFTTAGVPAGNTPPTVSLTAPSNGASYAAPADIVLSATAADADGSVSRVAFYAGSTQIGTDDTAPYQLVWNNVPAGTYALTARATDNLGATTTSAAVNVTVTAGTPTPLPSPWAQQDIGGVGLAGSASVNGATWTVSGSGTDVWGTADQFHYVFQPLAGDGSIVARVTSVQNVDQWTKAGVMVRESLTPGSAHAFMIVTPGGVKGLAFQRRTATDGLSAHTSGGAGTAPVWVKLTRTGSTITAYRSDDGANWTAVGSDTFAMGANVYAGLAVSSHTNGAVAAATFDNVVVGGGSGPPPPPVNTPPTVSMTSPSNGATFAAPAALTLSATAADSDGTVARVDFYSGSTLLGSDSTAPYSTAWSNVPAGTYTLTAVATDNAGAATTSSPVTVTVTAPSGLPSPWSQQDVGNVGVPGNGSVSGSTWTVSGSGADVWGTADEFHFVYQPMTGDGTIVARVATIQNVDQWTKAGVMIRSALTAGSAHAFMLVTPSVVKGLAFQRRTVTDGVSTHTAGGDGMPPAWVKLTRSGSTVTAYRSADGAAWTFVGSDTIAMGATVYVGLAVVSHNSGALATASFDNVSVGAAAPPPANTPPSVAVTSPSNGASFPAPATITLDASASDPDGTIARVDFFNGSTLVGTDTTSPYEVTWSNVAAGSYTITARATDNGGAQTTSASIGVTVTGGPGSTLPSPWAESDIGTVGAAGSASYASGTFTVAGSGADIWGTADQFHFVYRPMTGDGAIVARVDTIEAVNQWTKAGVMIRAALTPDSRHAMMIASPSKGLAFQRRVADGGLSTHTAGSASTAPVWVRLQRAGDIITASTSADGSTWTVVGSDTIAMPATVYVGLPVTSHSDGVLATATISNVSVAP